MPLKIPINNKPNKDKQPHSTKKQVSRSNLGKCGKPCSSHWQVGGCVLLPLESLAWEEGFARCSGHKHGWRRPLATPLPFPHFFFPCSLLFLFISLFPPSPFYLHPLSFPLQSLYRERKHLKANSDELKVLKVFASSRVLNQETNKQNQTFWGKILYPSHRGHWNLPHKQGWMNKASEFRRTFYSTNKNIFCIF